MRGQGEKLTRKQEAAIVALLAEQTVASAADKLGVGEATLGPMLLDDNVAFPGREVRMPFAAPGSFGKSLPLSRGDLAWVWMFPLDVITGLPAMVWHDEQLNFCSARGSDNLSHMIEQILILRDLFEQGPTACRPR